MRLLLIRHGQTTNNARGALDTSYPGAALSPLGEAQARAIPAALSEDPTAIYVSRLIRTSLTAAPLARALGQEVRVVPGLEEIGAGSLELRDDPESVRTYADCVIEWMQGRLTTRMPDGETGRQFLTRYEQAIRAIEEGHGPEETVAVVSHGAAIRVFTAVSTAMGPDAVRELSIRNTGMSVLVGSSERGWTLESWHADPLGGTLIDSPSAPDVTGEAV